MKALMTRRTALRQLSLAAGAGYVLGGRALHAADNPGPGALPHLDPHDATAVKFAYVDEASQVDPKKNPAFIAGSNCDNCLQLAGKAGDTWRPCALFPGKLVKTSGWCTAWTAEM